jgi:Rrf2 family transcriptional regulator, iron-sulfur cluster assembly transcription factor
VIRGMPLLSQKSALTIAAVLEIALQHDQGPLSARALARRLRLGPRHLEPVLHSFARAGILKATRGAIGGYRLGRERNRISVYDILRASKTSEESSDPLIAYSSALAAAIVEPALARAEQTFAAALQRISLEDLARWAERKASATINAAEPGAAES